MLSISSLPLLRNATYSIFKHVCYYEYVVSQQENLLLPNSADPRELAVYETVPEHDRQAWLTFVRSAHMREAIGIAPVYTFDQFEEGVAPHVEGFIEGLDDMVRTGIGGVALIPNYHNSITIAKGAHELTLQPVLEAFKGSETLLRTNLRHGPVCIVAPHPSLATPYVVSRSLIETMGQEFAHRIYIVIGPRPTVMQFELYDPRQKRIVEISPMQIGRTLGNVALTGPDTDSARNNVSLEAWLKILRRNFLRQLDSIMEPTEENNVIIYCPAGRIAEHGTEFRVDGSFDYLLKYPQASVWPVGVYDTLLQSAHTPQSTIYINPDNTMWWPKNEDEANYLHMRATELSCSPFGGLQFETQYEQKVRLIGQRIFNKRTKNTKPPYLSE